MADESRVPYAVAARDLLRNTLLDAAYELLRERTWGEVTMAQIAAAAGVSRQTVYNEFGSRADFAQALVLREGDRFLGDVERAVRDHPDDPAEALSAAFRVFFAGAAENPLLRSVAGGDADGESLLPFVTTQGRPVVELAVERLAAVIADSWPQIDDSEAHRLVDAVVRLALSYVSLPSTAPDFSPESVTALFAPFIERAAGR